MPRALQRPQRRAPEFPIRGRLPVPWRTAEVAWRTYHRIYGGRAIPLIELARCGGFGAVEFAVYYACAYMPEVPDELLELVRREQAERLRDLERQTFRRATQPCA